MKKTLALIALATLGTALTATAQDQVATGNMVEAVKTTMDANHDGMVSKEEFLKYYEKQYDSMQKTKAGLVMDEDVIKYLRGGH